MIAVDASAVLAVLLHEPEGDTFSAIMTDAPVCLMSPISWWEVQARVWAIAGDAGVARAQGVMDALGVVAEPVTLEVARVAHHAFTRYGKGVGGVLNLGDCFSYALAKEKGVPLLFKGSDFPTTDIAAAVS